MITAGIIAIGMYVSFLFGQHSVEQPLPAPKGLSVSIEKVEVTNAHRN